MAEMTAAEYAAHLIANPDRDGFYMNKDMLGEPIAVEVGDPAALRESFGTIGDIIVIGLAQGDLPLTEDGRGIVVGPLATTKGDMVLEVRIGLDPR